MRLAVIIACGLSFGSSGVAAAQTATPVVPCDTCGSIALQAPLTSCINTAACFSALLQIDQTISSAVAQAEACAADLPEYLTRANAASEALRSYLVSYQGDDVVAALSRWHEDTNVSSCNPTATEAGINAALGTLTDLFTNGCSGALPRNEGRLAALPERYDTTATTTETTIC